jgi:hypothetical protein
MLHKDPAVLDYFHSITFGDPAFLDAEKLRHYGGKDNNNYKHCYYRFHKTQTPPSLKQLRRAGGGNLPLIVLASHFHFVSPSAQNICAAVGIFGIRYEVRY